MKRMMAWALPMLLASAAYAQESVTRTETRSESASPATVTRSETNETRSGATTVETRSEAPAAVTSSRTASSTSVSYDDRLSAAYKSAGIPEEKVTRLREVDKRYREARKKDRNVKITEYRSEQEKIVTPEEATKIRTYFREQPVVERAPDYEATTWEHVETTPGTGVQVNTPLGSIGVGTPPQTTVRQETTVQPR